MMKKWFILIGLGFVAVSGKGYAQDSFTKMITKQELIEAGKEVYQNRCSGCHGIEGDGNGSSSPMLAPKPRNFKTGVFKFKSAPVGAMPSDADLLKTLTNGVVGTSMPAFKFMSEPQKMAVIEYIKTFAPDAWKAQSADSTVSPLQLPKGVFTSKQEFVKYSANGKVWFQEMGCVGCHGNSGKGDGPSAATLTDTWGQAIQPANLHNRYIKRGYTIQDVAASISFGVDGTPMPGYLDAVPDKTVIWELAAYVFYMRGRAAGMYAEEPIKAIPLDGKIPQAEVDAVMSKYVTQ